MCTRALKKEPLTTARERLREQDVVGVARARIALKGEAHGEDEEKWVFSESIYFFTGTIHSISSRFHLYSAHVFEDSLKMFGRSFWNFTARKKIVVIYRYTEKTE